MATPIDPNARFERQRTLAKQESNAEAQQAKDAMARRYASMGRLNSGAAIKSENKINQQSNDVLQRRLQSVSDAQETEGLRRQEIDEARKYQTGEREASQMFSRGEREGSQMFASQEAGIGRDFMRGERLGSQEFAGNQADINRRFQTSERTSSQDFAKFEANLARLFARDERHASQEFQRDDVLKKQFEQWEAQFKEDKRVTDFNMEMANDMKKANKRSTLQKVLDPGNFLGADAAEGKFRK